MMPAGRRTNNKSSMHAVPNCTWQSLTVASPAGRDFSRPGFVASLVARRKGFTVHTGGFENRFAVPAGSSL
jgi:hypothetical protein